MTFFFSAILLKRMEKLMRGARGHFLMLIDSSMHQI